MAAIGEHELSQIYDLALEMGKVAGAMLMDSMKKRTTEPSTSSLRIEEKDSSVDVVTQVDLDIEAYIKGTISKRFPAHDFIGEETYAKGGAREYLVTSAPTWIIDPLDGTINYTHLFPMFCVSIAFVLDGKPIIGIINAPFINQLFTSCRGRGSWLNGSQQLPLIRNPIPPLPADSPRGCTLGVEYGKDRKPGGNLDKKVKSFTTLAQGMVHGVRCLGSATLDLAFCAMGSLDIWWEGGCWEWDVAAGIAILEEAGGLITTANPPADLDTAPIPQVKLGSRLYLAIRPAGSSTTETGRQAQERTVREVWKRVETLDYHRPGS